MEEDGDKKVYHTPCLKQVIVCTNHRISPSQTSCGGRGGGELLAKRVEQEIAAKGCGMLENGLGITLGISSAVGLMGK